MANCSCDLALLSQKTRHMVVIIAAIHRLLPVPGGPCTSVMVRPAAVFRTPSCELLSPGCTSSVLMTSAIGPPALSKQTGGAIHETFCRAKRFALTRAPTNASVSIDAAAWMASSTARTISITPPSLQSHASLLFPGSSWRRECAACFCRRYVTSSKAMVRPHVPSWNSSTIFRRGLVILDWIVISRSPMAVMGAFSTLSKPSMARNPSALLRRLGWLHGLPRAGFG
mmetsp:Transcript_16218/g.38438  ORF Transcript_16218/g.38438 Transcript_16218/m.38438 type:complete len:227 (-) Transcript_16218:906-1586(-)